MAKIREEIVGKRFLCVSKSSKLKLSKIAEWDWRAGVIRACTHSDSKHPDLQVLVEYDDVTWQRREWVHVYGGESFQVLLLEHTLQWATHKDGARARLGLPTLWPVLVFEPLIDAVGLADAKERPVEHLFDRSLEFHDYSLLQPYQDELPPSCDPDCEECVRSWVAEQDGQRILCTTPSVLVGFRVQVYRSEGTTQWYTAVIVGYNDATRELTVTDDTVLEEHSEDPSLVHIRLLGEGVVESILRGENVGITPRRSRSSSNNHHQLGGVRHIRRDPIPSSRGRKSSLSKSSNPSSSPNQVLSPLSPAGPISPTSPLISTLPVSKLGSSGISLEPEVSVGEVSPASVDETSRDSLGSLSCQSSSSPKSDTARSSNSLPLQSIAKNDEATSESAKGQIRLQSESLLNDVQTVRSSPSTSPSSPTFPDKPTTPRLDSLPVSSCPYKDPICASKFDRDTALHFSDQNFNSASNDSKKGICTLDSSKDAGRRSKSPRSEDSFPSTNEPSQDTILTSKQTSVHEPNKLHQGKYIYLPELKVVLSPVKCDSVAKADSVKLLDKSSKNLEVSETQSLSSKEAKFGWNASENHQNKANSNLEEPQQPITENPAVGCSGTEVKEEPNDPEVTENPKKFTTENSKFPESDAEPCSKTPAEEAVDSESPEVKVETAGNRVEDCGDEEDPDQEVPKSKVPDNLTNLNNGIVKSAPRLITSSQTTTLPIRHGSQSVPDLLRFRNEKLCKDTRGRNPTIIFLEDSHSQEKDDLVSIRKVPDSTLQSNITEPRSISCESSFSIYPSINPRSAEKLLETRVTREPANNSLEVNNKASSLTDSHLALNKLGLPALTETGHISDVISCTSELSCRPVENTPTTRSSTANYSNSGQAKTAVENSSNKNSLTIFSVTPVAEVRKESVSPPGAAVPEPVSKDKSVDKGATGPVNNGAFSGLAQSLAVAGAVGGRAVTITATSGPAPQGTSRVASPPSVSITAVVRSPGSQYQQESSPACQDAAHGTQLQLFPHHSLVTSQHHQCSSASGNVSSSRMDQCDGSSDSGVSVTERSISRSSVLSDDRSSSAEVKPNTPTPTPVLAPLHSKTSQQQQPLALDRKEPVKVWRNPAVVSHSDSVRHIHSLQHSMSQHFPGVPPHVAPSGGPQGVSHSSSHPHGPPPPPPPTGSLPHSLPPGIPFPTHHATPHPLHIPPGLQPMSAAAAALYPPLQLGHVPSLQHAYSLIPRHQEEFYMEQQAAREQQSERLQRERREVEARDKQVKMERERSERQRKERERREREDRVRREGGEKKELQQLVNQHFEESLFLLANKRGLGRENQHRPTSVYYDQGLPVNPQATTTTTVPFSQSLIISQQHQNTVYQPHSQKGSPWSQSIGGIPVKMDSRDHRQQSSHSQHSEGLRKVKEPEQLVRDGICKAFRLGEHLQESHSKSHNPPPAHTKHPSEKISSSLQGYPTQYIAKETKHLQDRNAYAILHEKASVIVKPDLQYDKVPPHSVSPKQRLPEHSSPFSSAAGPNPYKPYDPSPSPHRGSTSHHSVPHSSSPLSVELTKARPSQSSPHSAPPAHSDRYYNSGTKPPVTNPYQPSLGPGGLTNHLHVNALPSKSKVSSPPAQMYGKPGITSGSPVCKVEQRPSQPLPLTNKTTSVSLSSGPPPAHSGSRNHESRPPPTQHEQRISHNRSPFEVRLYSSSAPSHLKPIGSTLPSHTMPRTTPPMSPHVTVSTTHHPTQTQPLDLGTRDDGTSPNRRRSQTPTLQDAKKPRMETFSSQPLLSRVSEPSPLYPSAATTITTVENTAALAKLKRVPSPVQHTNSSSLLQSSTVTIVNSANNTPSNSTSLSAAPDFAASITLNSKQSIQHPPQSTTPNSPGEETSSPGASKMSEPEKSNSPGLGGGGYIHKLKKVWLQRHKSGAEPFVASPSPIPNRVATPPPVSSAGGTTKSNSTPSKQEVKNALRKQPKPLIAPAMTNGHIEDTKEVESSTTDSEDSSSQKPKRGKVKRSLKRTKKSSESNSDSDKESDASEGSVKKQDRGTAKSDSEPRKKRGRKPKTKNEKDTKEDGSKPKKLKDDSPPNDPLHKPPISHLKKSGESFLQDKACYEVAPKLPKCRECRWTAHQRNKKMPNIFCRFYAFRRLRYTKNGQLAVAGFSDPVKDAFGEDLRLWVPDPSSLAPDLDKEMSKFLLTHVGDQFCDLVQQEKEAMALHIGDDDTIAWKRVVQAVREMCDVCETTLFNIHWACSKCGFVVCIDCYKGRKEGTVKVWDFEDGAKERDKYSWLLCASRVPHEQDKLMLTQIIAGNALGELGRKIHEVRYKWGIPMYCGCPEANHFKEKEQEDKKLNGLSKDLLKNIKKESQSDLVNGSVKTEKGDKLDNGKDEDMSNSPLNFFADVALSNDKRDSESSNSDSDSDSDEKGQSSTLRELLVRPNSKNSSKEDSSQSKTKEPSKKKAKLDTLDDVISCVIERGADKDSKKDPMKVELKHFIRKYNYNRRGREPLPIRIMTKTESRLLYPNVPHSWLCDGKLLRLHDSLHKENISVFQDQWKRGQPVIVSGTGNYLNGDLWKPSSFSRDFGDVKNNLINCLTDNIVPNQPMKKFWDGFEHYNKRLKDEKGLPMVLKLKDWPPGDDFAEVLPSRFEDLMKILPMGEYTRRNGCLNLAGRLPECFVRPDLGPKMYIAYGSSSYPNKASTNLHLDISDAANVMCYVGVPKDVPTEDYMIDSLKAIDEAGCDILTRQRVRDEVPGALWHIYHSRDADKIRDLLNKIAIERGKKLEPYHDPIHDQSWYLDGELRDRLYKDYGVEGYAIVQCMGDAVFVPAGTPHQVRNLQNCIKVAEDFVSPENVAHCFHLMQEFRHLSDTHTNHEDKLQIKNIIYHAMKDSLAYLMAADRTTTTTTTTMEDVKKEKCS